MAAKKKPFPRPLKLGDIVLIHHYGGQKGEIVEDRGNLGVGGERIWRIRVRRWPRSTYIELPEKYFDLVDQPT